MTAVLVAGASVAQANNIRITETTVGGVTAPYKSSSGGEFTAYDYDLSVVHPQSDLAWWDYNGDGIKNEFQTFCLEVNEPVLDKELVCYTIGDTAVMGGKGFLGKGGAVDWDGTAAGDPLSYATAYLFDAFYRGYLVGYDYTAAGRVDSARALQSAIWYLEDEQSKPGLGSAIGILANAFITKALDEANLTNGGTWGATYGQVRVMTIYDLQGNKLQDQLIMVPLPGAAWAGLAMLGALGMFRTIRRRKQS
jgi:hypothetical protein